MQDEDPELRIAALIAALDAEHKRVLAAMAALNATSAGLQQTVAQAARVSMQEALQGLHGELERAQQVLPRHDPDELLAPHDRKTLHAPLLHQSDHLADRRILGDGADVARHDLVNEAAGRMRVLVGEPARSHQELHPARPAAQGAGLGPAQEIALRHHADEGAARVDDRQSTEAVLQHHADGM